MADGPRKVPQETGNNAAISTQCIIYRVAGVEIDPSRASVTRDGQPIGLRNKTYRVLLYLLERPNRLVAKEELINGVWTGTAVSDDALTHCIAELRKAFDDDAKDPKVFRTFPKAGYGLTATVEMLEADSPPPAKLPSAPGRRKLPRWVAPAAGLVLAAACAAYAWILMRPAKPAFSESAWWKLDAPRGSAALDASGNGFNGKLTGGAAWAPGPRAEGRAPAAVAFGGLESVVTGKGGGGLPGGSAPRTITAWFKTSGMPVEDATIFEYGSDFRGETPGRFGLGMLSDGRLTFGAALRGAYTTGQGKWADGGWHMAAAAYEGPGSGAAEIYVDGALDRADKWTAVPSTDNNRPWAIGRTRLETASFLGAIGDVRVYPVALDASKIAAMFRCAAGPKDLENYTYLPISYPGLVIGERAPGDASAPIAQGGVSYGGMQLALPRADCSLQSLRGADAGQDLRISADILVPGDGKAGGTEAGPYFRSRAAMPGDGIIGGTSAGYWVQLHTSGMVRVKRLNPQAVVAYSQPDPAFDATRFHHLEIEARGNTLTARLDGKAVEFIAGGKLAVKAAIPPAWNGPPQLGRNDGAAGIGFSSELSHSRTGGQRVKNLRVTRLF